MQFLTIELDNCGYLISVKEIERLLPVSAILGLEVSEGRCPEFVVIENRPYKVRDLRKTIKGGVSTLFRGTRLMVPRNLGDVVFLCELVTGLVDLAASDSEVVVVSGRPHRQLMTQFLASGEVKHD